MNRPARAARPSWHSTPSRPEVEPDVALADRIRVLIADDHTTVLAGLASMIGLQPDMVVVAQATNGSDAVELWRKHRSEEHTSELQSHLNLVCRLLLEKKKGKNQSQSRTK